jgi:hypothetical protein
LRGCTSSPPRKDGSAGISLPGLPVGTGLIR